MGLIYAEDYGGSEVYICVECGIYLTHDCHFMSADFHGNRGPAILFDKVYNVIFGPVKAREMLTGLHFARDIFCKGCYTEIGWYYEFTNSPEQQYKEECTILEYNLVTKLEREFDECFHP